MAIQPIDFSSLQGFQKSPFLSAQDLQAAFLQKQAETANNNALTQAQVPLLQQQTQALATDTGLKQQQQAYQHQQGLLQLALPAYQERVKTYLASPQLPGSKPPTLEDTISQIQGAIGQQPPIIGVSPSAQQSPTSNPGFVGKIQQAESGGNDYNSSGGILTSPKGAQAAMQVMPATSSDPGFGVTPAANNSPQELDRVGKDYANAMLTKYQDPTLAAVAYNWGPGNTDKWLKNGGNFADLPAETQKYIGRVAPPGAQAANVASPVQSDATPQNPAADPTDSTLEPDSAFTAPTVPQTGKYVEGNEPGKVIAYDKQGNKREILPPGVAFDPNTNPQDAQTLDSVISGKLPIDNLRSDPTYRQQVVNAAVAKDPTFRADRFANISPFYKGDDANNIASASTLVEHADLYQQLFNAQKNGDIQTVNSIANKITSQFGDANPTNAQVAHTLLTDEAAKYLGGTGGSSDSSRAEAGKIFPTFNSPNQAVGSLSAFKGFMYGKLQAEEQKYKNAAGSKAPDFSTLLTPDAGAWYNSTKNNIAKGGNAVGQSQIKEGTTATNPQTGHKLTYKNGAWQG